MSFSFRFLLKHMRFRINTEVKMMKKVYGETISKEFILDKLNCPEDTNPCQNIISSCTVPWDYCVFVHFSLSLDIVLIDESFGLEILNLARQERHLPPTRVAFGGRWWVAMPSVNENGGRMVDIRSWD